MTTACNYYCRNCDRHFCHHWVTYLYYSGKESEAVRVDYAQVDFRPSLDLLNMEQHSIQC